MNVSKEEFIAEIKRRAGHLRALEAANRPMQRSTSTMVLSYNRSGRPPKPIEDREGVSLDDAFDEIERPIEDDVDPDYQ